MSVTQKKRRLDSLNVKIIPMVAPQNTLPETVRDSETFPELQRAVLDTGRDFYSKYELLLILAKIESMGDRQAPDCSYIT